MIKILTDSVADLPKDLCEQYHITVVPLQVIFGDEIYLDGIDLTHEAFFAKMAQSEKLPTTSQPTPQVYAELFAQEVDAGNEVIVITLAKVLSGCNQAAHLAKDIVGRGSIDIVDSKSACMGQGLLVLLAARMAAAGKSREEILAALDVAIENSRAFVMVATLDNLIKGGRLKPVAGAVANILNIKPMIEIDEEGHLINTAKVRGIQKGLQHIIKRMKEERADYTNATIALAHAHNPENADMLEAMIRENFQVGEILRCPTGSVIGTHIGEGAVAIFMIK
ncbi:MAG: DegV family protein [Peptococcaceae bacterium]|nr:DegV family protein [Peptococcaceae bacterium]